MTTYGGRCIVTATVTELHVHIMSNIERSEGQPVERTVTGTLQFYYETGAGHHPVVSSVNKSGQDFLDNAYYLEPGDKLTK